MKTQSFEAPPKRPPLTDRMPFSDRGAPHAYFEKSRVFLTLSVSPSDLYDARASRVRILGSVGASFVLSPYLSALNRASKRIVPKGQNLRKGQNVRFYNALFLGEQNSAHSFFGA